VDSVLGTVLAAGVVANAVILALLVLQAGRQARDEGAGSGSRFVVRRAPTASTFDGGPDGREDARRAGDSAVPEVPAAPSPTGSASVVVPPARPDPPDPVDDALARAIEAFVGSRAGDREGAPAPPGETSRGAQSDPARSRGSGASPGTTTSEPGSARIRITIERLDRIADRLGAAVADRVLEQVVSGIAAASRSSDRVARVTGDTIEVALAGAGVAAADRYAERTRRLCDDWFEGSALELRAAVFPAAPEGDDAAGTG